MLPAELGSQFHAHGTASGKVSVGDDCHEILRWSLECTKPPDPRPGFAEVNVDMGYSSIETEEGDMVRMELPLRSYEPSGYLNGKTMTFDAVCTYVSVAGGAIEYEFKSTGPLKIDDSKYETQGDPTPRDHVPAPRCEVNHPETVAFGEYRILFKRFSGDDDWNWIVLHGERTLAVDGQFVVMPTLHSAQEFVTLEEAKAAIVLYETAKLIKESGYEPPHGTFDSYIARAMRRYGEKIMENFRKRIVAEPVLPIEKQATTLTEIMTLYGLTATEVYNACSQTGRLPLLEDVLKLMGGPPLDPSIPPDATPGE